MFKSLPSNSNPEQNDSFHSRNPYARNNKSQIAPLLRSAFCTALVMVGNIYIAIEVFGMYGISLFVGIPLLTGFSAVVFFGYDRELHIWEAIWVSCLTALLLSFLLLLFGLEGLICIVMVLPLALPGVVIGGLTGHAFLKCFTPRRFSSRSAGLLLFLVLPFLMGAETWMRDREKLDPVRSVIKIDAPPSVVWNHVVRFDRLPEPEDPLFKTGVAYPTHATIKGRGTNAVRYCTFTTGSFVEPITVWEEPRVLEFDVTRTPPPMKELSPYDIQPNHLNGYFQSKRGRFRLVALPDQKTKLIGTTWYRNNLWPRWYWRLWSDFVIHRIHMRVLRHIKKNSEKRNRQGNEKYQFR